MPVARVEDCAVRSHRSSVARWSLGPVGSGIGEGDAGGCGRCPTAAAWSMSALPGALRHLNRPQVAGFVRGPGTRDAHPTAFKVGKIAQGRSAAQGGIRWRD
jgi:hypothetical protein